MKTYQEARKVLEKIKTASRVLITSHTNPDMDSVGSVLSFYQVVGQIGHAQVEVVLSDSIPEELEFLPFAKDVINKEITQTDFSVYDLVVFLDSATLGRVTRKLEPWVFSRNPLLVNIDHHKTNESYAHINLIDELSSTCELLFNLYEQWGVRFNKDIALCILTGITGDTGGFQYPGTSGDTLRIAGRLVDIGADPAVISHHTLRDSSLDKMRFWGLCLSGMQFVDVSGKKYVWTAIDFTEMQKFGRGDIKQGAEGFFAQVKDTDFGILMTEQERGILSGSLRARTRFDVSRIAQVLGGGGHEGAAGFRLTLRNLTFAQGVEKVHEVIKKVYGEEN